MTMETLEFIIYPDGRVKETVTGIVGASCQEVTAAIEAQLGRVVSQEKTSDYYTQPVNQSTKATDRVAFSDW
jgi:Holliday junction resolvasome RuvABC endonuclease subunit